jgi:hypothetical protein
MKEPERTLRKTGLCVLLLPLLSGCATTALKSALECPPETSETCIAYHEAAVSDREVFVRYEVERRRQGSWGGTIPTNIQRCAVWDRAGLADNVGPRAAPVRYKITDRSRMNFGPAKPIPIILVPWPDGTATVDGAALIVEDPRAWHGNRELPTNARLHIQADHGELSDYGIEVPTVSTHESSAWCYVVMPFAVVWDIATGPFQLLLLSTTPW